MAEEETKTEAAEAAENGTCPPKDTSEGGVGKEVKEENGVKEMEEDKADEKNEVLKADGENGLEKEGILKEDKIETTEDVKMDKGGLKEDEGDKKVEGRDGESAEVKETDEETREGKEEDEESKEEKEKDGEIKEEKENNEDIKQEKDNNEDIKEKKENDEDIKEDKVKSEEIKENKKMAEEIKEEKSTKKRRRGKHDEEKLGDRKKEVEEKKVKEPVTPVVSSLDRPVRERKSVERLVATVEKEQPKMLLIGKGRGTALKDIPNVAYKLSRKKTDETFIMLHVILFGRRGKAFNVKNNLSQFSGFTWHENEEKQKLKIKEKLDKCVKEKLLEFCDVLDIHFPKATTRKEDIVAKLIEFLEAPHATTNMLLAEKEQSSTAKKRKRVIKESASHSGATTAKRSARKRRKTDDSSKPKKSATETEDESQDEEDNENGNGITDQSGDEGTEHSEGEEKEDKSEKETKKHKQDSKKSSSKKESSGKVKIKKLASPKQDSPVTPPKKSSVKPSSKPPKNDNSIETSPKVFSRKKKIDETPLATKKSTVPSKSAKEKDGKEKTGKKVVKGKDKRKAKSGPTEDEIRDAICEILKEVDFNTATFTDILNKLARHFDMDLTSRKAAIKTVIQEELSKMAGEDEEDDDEEESQGKDDPESDG